MEFAAEEAEYLQALVAGVRARDPQAEAAFYCLLTRAVRNRFAAQQIPQADIDDATHSLYLITVQHIRAGKLREDERVMGYISTIAWRAIARYIDGRIRDRARRTDLSDTQRCEDFPDRMASPEAILIDQQQRRIMAKVLTSLPTKYQEVLRRFYLEEQPISLICDEMQLSTDQFRLLKHRAKAKFTTLVKQHLSTERGQRRAQGQLQQQTPTAAYLRETVAAG